MIGLLPVGTCPGDVTPKFSFFWSLPREDSDGWQARGMETWLNEVAMLWPQARERLQTVTMHTQLERPSYRDAVMARWYRDRVVLVGDVAHAMSSQLGQGVKIALMDAWALCEALRDQPDTALRSLTISIDAARVWRSISSGAVGLTPLFQSERELAARARSGFAAFGAVAR